MLRRAQPPTVTQHQTATPPLQLPTPPQNTPQPANASILQLRKAIDRGILGSKGKEYSGPLKAYYLAGKMFPRLIDPWLGIDSIFTYGMVVDGLLTTEEEEDGDESRAEQRKTMNARSENAYRHVLRLVPNFHSTIKLLCESMEDDQEYESSSLPKLFKVITDGKHKGREADTNKLKNATVEILQQLKLISGTGMPFLKSQRGFNHFDTGRLLCPSNMVDNYDEEMLGKLQKGTVEVTANDIPFFMYDNTRDTEDIFKGLCRGEFLICALRHMFFGSAIQICQEPDKRATKSPIAVKLDFKNITPPMIAYAATQARFVLSDISQWGMQDGLFDFQDYYYNILGLFEQPSDVWTKETLEFWNKTFFSNTGIIRRKRKVPPPPPKPTSDISKLKRIRDECYRLQLEAEAAFEASAAALVAATVLGQAPTALAANAPGQAPAPLAAA